MPTTTLPPEGFTTHAVEGEPFRITLSPCQIPGGLHLRVTGPDDFKGAGRILENLGGERWAVILRAGDFGPEDIRHPLVDTALQAAAEVAGNYMERNEEAVRAIWLEGAVALRELRRAYGDSQAAQFEETLAARIGVPLGTLQARAYEHGAVPAEPATDMESFARGLDAAGAHSLAWYVYDRRDEPLDEAFVMGFARERAEFDDDPLPEDPMRMRDIPIHGRDDADLARYAEDSFEAILAARPASAPSGP